MCRRMQACAGSDAAVRGPASNEADHPRGKSREPVVEMRGHAGAEDTRAWWSVAVRAVSDHVAERDVVERQAAFLEREMSLHDRPVLHVGSHRRVETCKRFELRFMAECAACLHVRLVARGARLGLCRVLAHQQHPMNETRDDKCTGTVIARSSTFVSRVTSMSATVGAHLDDVARPYPGCRSTLARPARCTATFSPISRLPGVLWLSATNVAVTTSSRCRTVV